MTGFPAPKKDAKWHKLHRSLQQNLRSQPSSPSCSADDLLLHLPRERDAWNIFSSKHLSSNLVVDLSQSAARGALRTDGFLPTITPGSKLAMASSRRVLTGLEKIMLHGFPIHQMQFADASSKQMETMGGNTMHTHVVGAAILLALGLVDWRLPEVEKPCFGCLNKKKRPKSTVHSPKFRPVSVTRFGEFKSKSNRNIRRTVTKQRAHPRLRLATRWG